MIFHDILISMIFNIFLLLWQLLIWEPIRLSFVCLIGFRGFEKIKQFYDYTQLKSLSLSLLHTHTHINKHTRIYSLSLKQTNLFSFCFSVGGRCFQISHLLSLFLILLSKIRDGPPRGGPRGFTIKTRKSSRF